MIKLCCYSLSVDADDSPSVMLVGTVVCPVSVVSVSSEWSETVAVPVVGRVVTPEDEIIVDTIIFNVMQHIHIFEDKFR